MVKAVRSGQKITVYNGPQHDKAYQLFWKRLAIDKQIGSLKIKVDNINHQRGYDWPQWIKQLRIQPAARQDFFQGERTLLTRDNFHTLLAHQRYDKVSQSLQQDVGLIKHTQATTQRTLKLLLASNLSESQWAELLSTAKKHNVQLDVTVLPQLKLPPAIQNEYKAEVAIDERTTTGPSPFILSSDADATLAQLLRDQEDTQTITVSECTPQDLLVQLDATVNPDTQHFIFTERIQVLLQTLQTNPTQRVVLTGRFSQKLLDALLPYVRQYPDRLTLISEEAILFAPFTANKQNISLDEKLSLLPNSGQDLVAAFGKDALKTLSYTELMTVSHYQQAHPHNNKLRASWQNFYQAGSLLKATDFNPQTAQKDAEQLIQQRTSLIEKALEQQPYVFISGLTGVGKSTFIEKYFAKKHTGQVFIGEQSIKEWAQKAEGGYLFIDEANLKERDWSEFEGLFNKPPFIIIDGKHYPLTPQHQVIFAGNPLNYGGSRHQASLFQRHGNAILFDPLPANVIYHDILQPMFAKTPLAPYTNLLSAELLETYNYLLSWPQQDILITPRQLKAIVMLTLAKYEANQDQDAVVKRLKHNIQRVLRPSLSPEQQQAFDNRFGSPPKSSDNSFISGNNYLITPSRQPVYKLIKDFLALRDFKQKNQTKLNDDQLYGDLNSIILESMPGLGKTELLKAMMAEQGIKPANLHHRKLQHNAYYLLPASLSFVEKERLLRKAFDEGNVVIMDEINASPMMERLVNSWGKPPKANDRKNQASCYWEPKIPQPWVLESDKRLHKKPESSNVISTITLIVK